MLGKNKHDFLLERAKKHIFSTGVGDCASMLARTNMKYGLAKMHLVQEKYGLEPNATFISSPDETISRNPTRWDQGISYGGKISWGNGKEKVIILDTKPNCCGMLVGGIDKVPHPKELIQDLYKLENKETYIKDLKIKWDINKGNHFIDVFLVKRVKEGPKLPKYAAILHSGLPEMKADNEFGPGLYWNESETLQKMYQTVNTPFGPMYVVVDNDAKEYMRIHKIGEEISKKRRQIMFEEVFHSKNVMINEMHQGLLNYNEITLGCQQVGTAPLLPMSIRADLPSYLLQGKKNLTQQQIETLGFEGRAQKLGVMDRLKKANILPHGGGYKFPAMLDVEEVFEIEGKRFFDINMANDRGKCIVQDVKELEFDYRSREVLLKTIELGLGEIVAKLIPIYVLKI